MHKVAGHHKTQLCSGHAPSDQYIRRRTLPYLPAPLQTRRRLCKQDYQKLLYISTPLCTFLFVSLRLLILSHSFLVSSFLHVSVYFSISSFSLILFRLLVLCHSFLVSSFFPVSFYFFPFLLFLSFCLLSFILICLNSLKKKSFKRVPCTSIVIVHKVKHAKGY